MNAAEMPSGVAPPTARSLMVPLTASSPMSPPGKKSGLTTNESVVTARPRWSTPGARSTAWSPSWSSTGLLRMSPKSAVTSVWLAFPPAPWLIVIASSRSDGLRLRISAMRSSTRCSGSAIRADAALIAAPLPGSTMVSVIAPAPRMGTRSCSATAPLAWPLPLVCSPDAEHALALTCARVPAEVVVRGARALRRHHAGADRRLRRACRAEHLALPRLEDALEHLAALACLGVRHANAGHGEHLLRVEVGVLVLQLEGALADEPEAAPLEMRAQLEHAREHLERLRIAVIVDDALVLVLDLAASLVDLLDDHVHALEDVERLEPDHDDGLVVCAGDELEGPDPDDGRHVPRAEEAVELQVGRVEDRLHRRDDRDVVAEDEEVANALGLGSHQGQRRRRRGGLEADRVEHDLAVGVLLRDLQARRAANRPCARRRRQPWRRAGSRRCPGTRIRSPKHVKITPGSMRDGDAVVEASHRDHAHGASGSVHELDVARQQVLDAVLEDRVGVPTAHLHDLPVLVARLGGDARTQSAGEVGVAEFVCELHAGVPLPSR